MPLPGNRRKTRPYSPRSSSPPLGLSLPLPRCACRATLLPSRACRDFGTKRARRFRVCPCPRERWEAPGNWVWTTLFVPCPLTRRDSTRKGLSWTRSATPSGFAMNTVPSSWRWTGRGGSCVASPRATACRRFWRSASPTGVLRASPSPPRDASWRRCRASSTWTETSRRAPLPSRASWSWIRTRRGCASSLTPWTERLTPSAPTRRWGTSPRWGKTAFSWWSRERARTETCGTGSTWWIPRRPPTSAPSLSRERTWRRPQTENGRRRG